MDNSTTSSGTTYFPGLRPVPMTGVIYVTSQATKHGYSATDPVWANLGQGAPEVGSWNEQENTTTLTIESQHDEYAPVAGAWELRERIAHLYNELFRKNKTSKYTAENVAVSSGGRLGLTRIAAVLGNIHVGHLIPDYTAYEELLTTFKAFTPIPILCEEENGYTLSPAEIHNRITGLGLGAVLLSNPCNPTGQLLRDQELEGWIDAARHNDCLLIMDEFYAHYIYDQHDDSSHNIVSAAAGVEDVNRDPVIIVDGLTKSWRRPGWRISWTVGPRDVIEAISSAGSFLDGGAPHPLQHAAIPLLDVERVVREAGALQRTFADKREYTLQQLNALGFDVPHPPQGSFYCWVKLHNLPEPLRDGMTLFEEGLKEKVITVPGEFFDVNPGKRRKSGAYREYSRISFGPDMQTLERGFAALQRVIHKHR